ncbi:hypothetical protein L0222_00995 [bacterium]|nr:hypothetical protein [bacterium]MCI0603042.1 hypothetical protein [bacterium]
MAESQSAWKYLPIIIGVAIGWMIFNPPNFLRELGAISYVIMILAGLVALIIFCGFAIHANLPKDVMIRRSTTTAFPGEMTKLSEDFKSLGFIQTSEVPLTVNVAPPALLIPFVNEKEQTYGSVYKTETIPPKITFDLVSIFEGNRGGLTSGTLAEGAAMPSLGSLKQVFLRENVRNVFEKHRQAVQYLKGRGILCRSISPQTYERDLRESILRLRKSFLASPVLFTLTVLWRAATKQTPHMGPVQTQQVAQQQIKEIISGKTIPHR